MEQDKEDSSLHFIDYWRVITNRKEIVLAVMLLVIVTGTSVTWMLPKKYMGETRLLVKQDATDIDVFERQMEMGYNPYFLRTQYETIRSKSILYKVIQNLDLQSLWADEYNDGQPLPRELTYRILSHMLNVEQFRDTSMIAIQVFSEKPADASNIANEIAEVYKEYRLEIKRREIRRGIDALTSELQKQQDKVDESEMAVEIIRKDLGINMISRDIRADKVRLQQLEADRIGARVDMLVRKARLEQLEQLSGNELMNASTYVAQDINLENLRRQLMDTEVSLQLMLENYGENHPEVRRLKAAHLKLKQQLDNALNGLIEGLRVDYEVSRQKFAALAEELDLAREKDIQSERDQFRPFERATRNLDVQVSILNALRARVAQEGIAMEVPRTPVEIVDLAEPPVKPVSPKVMLNIALSIVLGIFSGIGLAYFVEYLDTSVKTVDDVERYLSLPVIGIIPQKVQPLINEGDESPHAEAYRVLRTNVQFAHGGDMKGVYTVVSGGVGEGKSTTLFNLAYITARQGYKVLIVDSDLRRPVQHKILGMGNEFGLTNVLMKDVSVDKAVKTTAEPNLFFLPSGRLPRASIGILDSQKMKELVGILRSRYDCIFFDSPPVMGVSDAVVLASEVDGVVLVVQYRKYPKMISLRAKKLIDHSGAKLLGVVLNNINIMRDDYYYYYNSYYSHYYDGRDNLDDVVKKTKKRKTPPQNTTEKGV